MTVVYTNPVKYTTYVCTAVDGDIVAAPGAGYKIRVHHIYVVNLDDTDISFYIHNGTSGIDFWSFYLAAYGGAVAQNLRHPWDLNENTELWYNFISGTTPNAFIRIGYEVVST